MKHKLNLWLFGIAAGIGLQTNAAATQVRVTVENLTPAGGLYFTPVWVGFHDGSFDTFNAGDPASSSLEALAEEGDVSGIRGDFMVDAPGGQDGIVFAPAGFAGAPVFDPGEADSLTLTLDPVSDRYFSFASMVIPSNDAFIGNSNPLAYQIFSATGVFTGPLEILVLGTAIWDAGTEVNDGQGAAFLSLGGISTDEAGLVGLHPGFPYAEILAGPTAAGTTIDPGLFSDPAYQLARLTISRIPEPQIVAMFGLGFGLMTLVGKRRRAGRTSAPGPVRAA